MKIKAPIIAMAANEILSMIPPFVLEDIKRRDPKPLFKAFVVGQEGQAAATWVGVGKIVKTWFADAIGKLARRIFVGMRLFHNHAPTNEQEGRIEIGEVAGTRTKNVDGKFSAIIAAYIYPEYKTLPLNVASIEADITIDSLDPNSDVRAVDVENVSAIALGDKAKNNPGFPGAELLGQLQAYEESYQIQSNKGANMELQEVKDFLKERGLKPSDVFGKVEISDDPLVKGIIKDAETEASGGEYAHRKRTKDALQKAKTAHEEETKTLKDENAALKKAGAKTTAETLITQKIIDRKLDTKQAEYIKAKKAEFDPQDPETVDKEVDAFMDKALISFKQDAKIFGVETKEENVDLGPGGEPNEAGEGGAEDNLMPVV